MARNPTNGELLIMLQDMDKSDREAHARLLGEVGEVKTHAAMTNGRIRKLEQWKFMMMGAVGILNIMVVPLIIYWFTHTLK